MVNFHSYVKLPEGNPKETRFFSFGAFYGYYVDIMRISAGIEGPDPFEYSHS